MVIPPSTTSFPASVFSLVRMVRVHSAEETTASMLGKVARLGDAVVALKVTTRWPGSTPSFTTVP